MIQARMSRLPRVENNGLCLAFLSLLSQTLHSSPNPPTIPEPQAFCTPAPLPHPTLADLCLTCEQQHQDEGKKVYIGRQEVGHMQRESLLEHLRDVVPNQAVKGVAPGSGLTGSRYSSKR